MPETQQGNSVKISGGELIPGMVLDNRLEVVRRISRGVKESVYICKQLVAPFQTVVLKLLPRGRAGEDQQTTFARFQREILALYSISHPNIVNVYEAINDSQVFGYTMEYVDGGNLDELLEEGEQLDIERIVDILQQTCAGLQKIHEAGVIHRALKPKNILLTHDGIVKITDFAVAKIEGQKKLTVQGTVIGTMDYVSPEYVTRGVLDHRLDIYSAGVIGYEMITGTTPFQSDDFIDTLSKRASLDPEAPDELNPACPARLGRIILKAVHRDPEQRYQTAGEMLEDLNRFLLEGEESAAPMEPFFPEDTFAEQPSERQPSVTPFEQTPPMRDANEGFFGPEWDEYQDEPTRNSSTVIYWISSGVLGFGMGWIVLMYLQSNW